MVFQSDEQKKKFYFLSDKFDTPGKIFPSNNSKLAPPPVET